VVGPALSRCALGAVTFIALTFPYLANAGDGGTSRIENASPASSIVIGFVGGFVAHNNPHHGPVQFAERLRSALPHGTYVRVFENRRRKQAFAEILRLLDSNGDGTVSPQEKARARIILFGHSWGGAAAVVLARELRKAGVPVMLTVQIDSVAKMWQNDSVIPDNVAAAVNFYQPHGFLQGDPEITAANPAKTRIIGNYLFDYKKNPITCPNVSWANWLLIRGHVQSECDPHIWSEIEEMVRERLEPGKEYSTSSSNGAAITPQ
jgi:pimeloyl-ACP methyl ester carboxylesterase